MSVALWEMQARTALEKPRYLGWRIQTALPQNRTEGSQLYEVHPRCTTRSNVYWFEVSVLSPVRRNLEKSCRSS
jgi:hypothetical protein